MFPFGPSGASSRRPSGSRAACKMIRLRAVEVAAILAVVGRSWSRGLGQGGVHFLTSFREPRLIIFSLLPPLSPVRIWTRFFLSAGFSGLRLWPCARCARQAQGTALCALRANWLCALNANSLCPLNANWLCTLNANRLCALNANWLCAFSANSLCALNWLCA